MKKAVFSISGDCMSSPDAPITIKDGQKVVCTKYEGSIYNIDALSGKVCIILCDDEHKGVCKEVFGIDEILDVLRLKYYVPEQTIVSIEIDRIKDIYIVEAVIMENKTQNKPAEEVKTCKIVGLEPLTMIKRLGKITDRERALGLIKTTFEKQLGAAEDNRIFIETGLFEKGGITLKKFINTTDENQLFPHLVCECKIIADEQLKQPNENERAKRYLDNFIEKWRSGNNSPTQEDINNNSPTQEEKELREILLAGLNEKTIDELIRELANPKLKNRDVARIYKKYNKEGKLKDKGIHFNFFCEAVIKYLDKEDCCGWNYNAIRFHLK